MGRRQLGATKATAASRQRAAAAPAPADPKPSALERAFSAQSSSSSHATSTSAACAPGAAADAPMEESTGDGAAAAIAAPASKQQLKSDASMDEPESKEPPTRVRRAAALTATSLLHAQAKEKGHPFLSIEVGGSAGAAAKPSHADGARGRARSSAAHEEKKRAASASSGDDSEDAEAQDSSEEEEDEEDDAPPSSDSSDAEYGAGGRRKKKKSARASAQGADKRHRSSKFARPAVYKQEVDKAQFGLLAQKSFAKGNLFERVAAAAAAVRARQHKAGADDASAASADVEMPPRSQREEESKNERKRGGRRKKAVESDQEEEQEHDAAEEDAEEEDQEEDDESQAREEHKGDRSSDEDREGDRSSSDEDDDNSDVEVDEEKSQQGKSSGGAAAAAGPAAGAAAASSKRKGPIVPDPRASDQMAMTLLDSANEAATVGVIAAILSLPVERLAAIVNVRSYLDGDTFLMRVVRCFVQKHHISIQAHIDKLLEAAQHADVTITNFENASLLHVLTRADTYQMKIQRYNRERWYHSNGESLTLTDLPQYVTRIKDRNKSVAFTDALIRLCIAKHASWTEPDCKGNVPLVRLASLASEYKMRASLFASLLRQNPPLPLSAVDANGDTVLHVLFRESHHGWANAFQKVGPKLASWPHVLRAIDPLQGNRDGITLIALYARACSVHFGAESEYPEQLMIKWQAEEYNTVKRILNDHLIADLSNICAEYALGKPLRVSGRLNSRDLEAIFRREKTKKFFERKAKREAEERRREEQEATKRRNAAIAKARAEAEAKRKKQAGGSAAGGAAAAASSAAAAAAPAAAAEPDHDYYSDEDAFMASLHAHADEPLNSDDEEAMLAQLEAEGMDASARGDDASSDSDDASDNSDDDGAGGASASFSAGLWGSCPSGLKCTKLNPQHFQRYSHPREHPRAPGHERKATKKAAKHTKKMLLKLKNRAKPAAPKPQPALRIARSLSPGAEAAAPSAAADPWEEQHAAELAADDATAEDAVMQAWVAHGPEPVPQPPPPPAPAEAPVPMDLD